MDSSNHRDTAFTPDWDTTLHALTASRRRVTLAELETAGGALSVDDLATTIYEAERRSDATVERVGLSLIHTHLPNLVDSGLVTMESDDRARLTQTAYDHPLVLPLAQWSQEPSSIPSPLFDAVQSD